MRYNYKRQHRVLQLRALDALSYFSVFPMYTFRIIFACFMILLLFPQTPKLNLLLRFLHSTEQFETYRAAETFLKRLTVGTMLVFFGVNYFLAK